MKIYCDFDGVITHSVKRIVDMYNEDFYYYKNFKKIDYNDINTWSFDELTLADKKTIDHYFNRSRFFNGLEFMPDAHKILSRLAVKHKIIIVSMGYSPNLRGKKEWIELHLPFADFIACNYKQYSDKSHIDMSDGIFIDDSSKNLFTSNSPYPILFGETYTWNENWTGTIKRTWDDIYQYVNEIEKRL